MPLTFKRSGVGMKLHKSFTGTYPKKVPPGKWVVVTMKYGRVEVKEFDNYGDAELHQDRESSGLSNSFVVGPGSRYNPDTGAILESKFGSLVGQINELSYPDGFNLNKLKKIETAAERVKYVRKYLGPSIGTGTARVVFPVGSEKVLKVAMNRKGLAQNKHEIKLRFPGNPLLAKIYDFEIGGSWLEMEKLDPVSNSEFATLSGGINIKDLTALNKRLKYERTGFFEPGISPPSMFSTWDEVWHHPFAKMYFELSGEHPQIQLGDIAKLASWGKNKQGKLRILDYGLSKEILRKHYQEIDYS